MPAFSSGPPNGGDSVSQMVLMVLEHSQQALRNGGMGTVSRGPGTRVNKNPLQIYAWHGGRSSLEA